MTGSHRAKCIYRGKQDCTASRFMAFVGNHNAVDGMVWITLGNGAIAMILPWAGAHVANPSHCNAANREMGRGDAHDLATMAGGVV